MKPYFDSVERRNALLYHAVQWQGTPWRARSCAKGQGVSCHNFPRALYIESKFLDEGFPIIEETPNIAKHTRRSLMAEFIDERKEFLQVMRDNYQPACGDLLGIQIGLCVNHLGVVLEGGRFTHTLMKLNTCMSLFSDPTWSSRVKRIWRPIV